MSLASILEKFEEGDYEDAWMELHMFLYNQKTSYSFTKSELVTIYNALLKSNGGLGGDFYEQLFNNFTLRELGKSLFSVDKNSLNIQELQVEYLKRGGKYSSSQGLLLGNDIENTINLLPAPYTIFDVYYLLACKSASKYIELLTSEEPTSWLITLKNNLLESTINLDDLSEYEEDLYYAITGSNDTRSFEILSAYYELFVSDNVNNFFNDPYLIDLEDESYYQDDHIVAIRTQDNEDIKVIITSDDNLISDNLINRGNITLSIPSKTLTFFAPTMEEISRFIVFDNDKVTFDLYTDDKNFPLLVILKIIE